MKKYCLALIVVAISMIFMAGTGFARSLPPIPVPENDTPYMTLSGDTVQKTTAFGWDEKPFVYLELSGIDSSRALRLQNIWKYGGSPDIVTQDTFSGISSYADWTGLKNWDDSGIRKTGDWILETTWGYTDSRNSYCVKSPFTVTPEPFSAALFLLGGVALSTRKLFKGKKKHLVLLLAFTLGLGLMSGTGYAGSTVNPLPPYPADETPTMTFASPDTTPQATFGWNEQPFIYLNLPEVDSLRKLNLQHIWKYGGSVEYTQDFSSQGVSSLQDWKGSSNWFGTGLGSRKTGEWTVETTFGYDGSKYSACCAETKFTVTPEPVSAALFLIGGVALSTRRFFKKKK